MQELAHDLVQKALDLGATQAEVSLQSSQGFEAKVRKGEVDTVSFNRDQHLSIEVYVGKQSGSASTSDFRTDSVNAAVETACQIARVTQADDCNGLIDPQYIAKDYPDVDLYHPWGIQMQDAIALAKQCEAAAFQVDKRITNSDGATVASADSFHVYANSLGFLGSCPSSKHQISCLVLAQHSHDMQRDYWYTIARNAHDLQNSESVGEMAAQRALRKLDAKRLKTMKTGVIFAAEVAGSFWGHFLGAISGGNLYRHASFLCDHLGKSIFPDFIHIHENPHIKGALGSNPFDSEGMKTYAKDFVKNGILQQYILSSYSARKLHLQPSGNADGVHNLLIDPQEMDLPVLFKAMDRGLYVTELMGQGVNLVTGNYSRGVSGFWIENGVIQYPVHEITIAGNLADMFKQINAVGNDIDKRGNILTGSVWIDNMMIAGE